MVTEKMNIADETLRGGNRGRLFRQTSGGGPAPRGAFTSRRWPEKTPDRIVSVQVDPRFGFYPYHARSLLGKLGPEKPALLLSFADVLVRLYKVFSQLEGMIVENQSVGRARGRKNSAPWTRSWRWITPPLKTHNP